MELSRLLFECSDESEILRRVSPLIALAGGLGLGRAFLFVADAERAVLAGRYAVGPMDAEEAARFPAAPDPAAFDDQMRALTDADLDQAAPDLTAHTRGLALPLVEGLDPVVDTFLRGGASAFEPRTTPPATWRVRLGLGRFAVAAICVDGQPIALLIADDGFRGTPWGDSEALVLAAFADAAGRAIAASRAARELAERSAQLATLEELAKSTFSATSLRTELTLLVRAGTQALNCRGGVLWRTQGERMALLLESVHASDDRSDPLRQAEALEPLARAALRDRTAHAVPDAAGDPHLDPAAVRGFGAVYLTPLVTPQGVAGVLAFFGPAPRALSERAGFDRTDHRVAESVAAQAASVLCQARLSDRVREAEARLAESLRHVANNEKLAALGAIAARAAQESQNPLASIGGFARRVHRALAADDPNREYVEIILREADRIERLLGEQIKFADLSRPRLALENVNQVIAGVLTSLAGDMVKRRVRLLKKLAPDVPQLLLDADKIRQVVRNILDNALEQVPQGGRIRVESRRSQGYVVVEIASDAPPLSGDMLEQLFVPFAATRRTGDHVGLALAQQVVQSHGGEIRVRSEGDWGVIFSFTLPVSENADRRRSQDRRGVRMDRRNRFPAA